MLTPWNDEPPANEWQDEHAPRYGPLEWALLALVLVIVASVVWLGPVR